MAALGRLPTLGDEVLLPTPGANWRLSVAGMDGRRVSRVALSTGLGTLPAPDPRSNQRRTPRPNQRRSQRGT